MTSLALNSNDWKYNSNTGLQDDSQGSIARPQMQTAEQRHVLRMLEKSLARELDFEKKLTVLTEQLSSFMEEAAELIKNLNVLEEDPNKIIHLTRTEVVWGGLYRGRQYSRGLHRTVESQRNSYTKGQKLSISEPHLMTNGTEVITLREKVDILEEKLRESMSQLQKANESNKEYQKHIQEMDYTIESLKENIYDAENRADAAENKTMQLNEANLELTEEIGLLKGSNDSNTKKASLLEKRSRDLELHARALSLA
ncbi:hypothetical protein AgCh_002740 [Apium graveolens]